MKKIIIVLLSIIFSSVLFAQDIIISGNKVLIQQNDSLYREAKPEIISDIENIYMLMPKSEFWKNAKDAREYLKYDLQRETSILGNDVEAFYSFNYIDNRYDGDLVLTKILYSFTQPIDDIKFKELNDFILSKLDGIPLKTELYLPKQILEFNYKDRIYIPVEEIEYTAIWKSDCGEFQISLTNDKNRVELEYYGSGQLDLTY